MRKHYTPNFLILVFGIFIMQGISAQFISPTNIQGTKPLPCFDCAPANWFDFGGTPDMSNRTTAAATGTSGGGTTWTQSPLPLPPNGHTNWITIRDIGSAGTEESVGTNITGLTSGREYELVAYTLSSVAPSYSPNYIDRFDYQLGFLPRVAVTSINRDTDGEWGVSRLRFIANSSSMQFAFFPGSGATSGSFESVNISVSLNAINTIPVVEEKTTATSLNTPVTINVLANAVDYDIGQSVVVGSIDLDTSTSGIQGSMTTAEGNWVVNHTSGEVTFTPTTNFLGTAVLSYTIQDDFTLDGISSPGTSASKNITVNVLNEICTEEVEGEDFTLRDGETVTFSQPPTDYGFQFDIYRLDNSFNLEINGTMLATQEIQFYQPDGANIRFLDGDMYGSDVPEIWSIIGNTSVPSVRVIIGPTGTVSMYGSKTSGGALEPLELFNGNQFNTIPWNPNSSNTIIGSQSVNGATYMIGYGSGLNIVPCFCVKPGTSGSPAGFSTVGILTKENPSISNWPEVVPNGYLVLDASDRGMVVTHMNTAQRDALTAINGMVIYNTDEGCLQLYRGETPGIDDERTGWNCIKRGCNEE